MIHPRFEILTSIRAFPEENPEAPWRGVCELVDLDMGHRLVVHGEWEAFEEQCELHRYGRRLAEIVRAALRTRSAAINGVRHECPFSICTRGYVSDPLKGRIVPCVHTFCKEVAYVSGDMPFAVVAQRGRFMLPVGASSIEPDLTRYRELAGKYLGLEANGVVADPSKR